MPPRVLRKTLESELGLRHEWVGGPPFCTVKTLGTSELITSKSQLLRLRLVHHSCTKRREEYIHHEFVSSEHPGSKPQSSTEQYLGWHFCSHTQYGEV